MHKLSFKKVVLLLSSFLIALAASNVYADESPKIEPTILFKLFDQVKNNDNWKKAMVTGKQAQVVFMSVSPKTNPKNEIGMETHEFDQVIIIVDGKAKVDLNGKVSNVNPMDLVFVPQGTPHNVINLAGDKPLKLVSIYSQTDIPTGTILKTKS